MGRAVVCLAGLLMAAAAAPGQAQTCPTSAPSVNKPGFRDHQIVAFSVAPSPGGAAFPDEMRACVWRAFQAWNAANAAAALDVVFVPGHGGVVVRYDERDGLLPERAAGAWQEVSRGDDGALEQADVWLSPDRRLIDSCEAVTKVVLHELGHMHGLADAHGDGAPTVMNHPVEKNDRSGRMPLTPTACDAAQAVVASRVVGERWIRAGRPAWRPYGRLAAAVWR